MKTKKSWLCGTKVENPNIAFGEKVYNPSLLINNGQYLTFE